MRCEYIERSYSIGGHIIKSHAINQSQLTEHLQQFYFDLLNLVRFGQLSDLSHGTIPFDIDEILFKLTMQYKTHKGRKMEETRDE